MADVKVAPRKFTELTEREVALALALLEAKGFKYDEDFTTLYGAEWVSTGVETLTENATWLLISVLEGGC